MSCDSELQLFRKIKGSYLENRIERNIYNKRKRNLFEFIERIKTNLSEKHSQDCDVFIVDSKPVPICETIRAKRSSICSTEQIKPTFGYRSSGKTHNFGYNLHTLCDSDGVIHSFDFTPANIHDIHYLNPYYV